MILLKKVCASPLLVFLMSNQKENEIKEYVKDEKNTLEKDVALIKTKINKLYSSDDELNKELSKNSLKRGLSDDNCESSDLKRIRNNGDDSSSNNLNSRDNSKIDLSSRNDSSVTLSTDSSGKSNLSVSTVDSAVATGTTVPNSMSVTSEQSSTKPTAVNNSTSNTTSANPHNQSPLDYVIEKQSTEMMDIYDSDGGD